MGIVLADVNIPSKDSGPSSYTVKPWRKIAKEGKIATYVNPTEGVAQELGKG